MPSGRPQGRMSMSNMKSDLKNKNSSSKNRRRKSKNSLLRRMFRKTKKTNTLSPLPARTSKGSVGPRRSYSGNNSKRVSRSWSRN